MSMAAMATRPLLVALFALIMPLSAAAQNASADHSDGSTLNIDIDEALQEVLFESYKSRGDNYKPRTEHFKSDGTPLYINRLIQEDSPYLLQHAHNPVNWHPWGKEAFDKAKKLDRPVFLSIGYATCHWCHVMERESFENEEVARQLNKQFVAIKVDREQLPDVDALYMLGVQVTTGGGGWPLSAFLQPDAKLFHGATYMPPEIFKQRMNQIDEVWANDRESITRFADELSIAIEQNSNLSGEVRRVGEQELVSALESMMLSYDSFQGGFGAAPKFPRESTLFFLLDTAQREGDADALEAVDFTLTRMAAGGIHDQIGGGFHRYAVDSDWLIPHFEKMLYTQASLLQIYLQAFELTGNKEHARTARRIADYVIRDMTSETGGFYSATDADSEGEEGTYFIWSEQELAKILTDSFGKEDAQLALDVWGLSDEGNFEGHNILRLEDSIKHVASLYGITEADLAAQLSRFSGVLLAHREKRIPPLTDRKIITEWNAMMSTALIKAAETLNDPRYMQAAMDSINFMLENNRLDDGSLWRANFLGRATTPASQADYAYLAQALIAMFDATSDKRFLDLSIQLVSKMDELFWDQENSGYFIGLAAVTGATLPTRPKAIFDNASPTGNSVALRVLVQLYNRTADDNYKVRAESLVAAFSPWLARDGSGFGYLLTGINDLLNGEAGQHRYSAKGKVKASVSVSTTGTVDFIIEVAPGWHINSDKPLQDYLIPTSLILVNAEPLKNVSYPEAVTRQLGFQRSKLDLFEGKFQITGELPKPSADLNTAEVELQIQACSDEICLAPESLLFTVPLTALDPSY